MSASVNLSLHHKAGSSLLAPADPGGPGKRAVKWLCGDVSKQYVFVMTTLWNRAGHYIVIL